MHERLQHMLDLESQSLDVSMFAEEGGKQGLAASADDPLNFSLNIGAGTECGHSVLSSTADNAGIGSEPPNPLLCSSCGNGIAHVRNVQTD